MEFAIVLALAIGFGFVLGLIVGARRALNLVMSGRALRSTNSALAELMPGSMPSRTQEDILAGVVRIRLGGTTYPLPVLPRAASKRWLETLDARFAALALTLDQAGDDTPAILTALVTETDALYDMLLTYDRDAILPPRAEIDEIATDAQILHAVLEVWRAVHPLAANVMQAPGGETGGTSPAPSSSPRRPTGGPPSTSTDSSPTSSSSPTSTPQPIASARPRAVSGRQPSKPSASAR